MHISNVAGTHIEGLHSGPAQLARPAKEGAEHV